jgi:hypothetical protein
MERFRDEELPEKIWKALADKERLEADRRERFQAKLEAEKVAKTAERAEAVEAFVAFGCGYAWEAENLLLQTIEARIFGAVEEE